MMSRLSIPMRVLLFVMGVAVTIPLCLWLIVQGYEWLCGAGIVCGGVE